MPAINCRQLSGGCGGAAAFHHQSRIEPSHAAAAARVERMRAVDPWLPADANCSTIRGNVSHAEVKRRRDLSNRCYLERQLRAKFDCTPPPRPVASLCGRGTCKCPCTDTRVINTRAPLRWVHVPKAGTSLANLCMRLACDDLPDWAAIRLTSPDPFLGSLPRWYSHCFGGIVPGRCRGFTPSLWKTMVGHTSLREAEGYAILRGELRAVIVLREPLARLVSEYNFFIVQQVTLQTL